MFWKFVVGALVLPGCLGLEIATASLGKDNTNILPKSEEVELSLAKTQNYKDVEQPLPQTTSESSTIVNTEQLTEGADMPLKISHRRYYRRPCYRRRRYRRHHYRRRYYHPAYYRRRHRRRRHYRRNRYHRHYHKHYYRRGHRRHHYHHRHYHRH